MAERYNLAPSDFDAGAANIQARLGQFNVNIDGNLSTGLRLAGCVPSRIRILKVVAYRATAGAGIGAGGSTDVDINVRPLGGANASIMPANAIEFEQADGANLTIVRTPNEALAAWDGTGIVVEPGAVVSVEVDAIEAGATAPTGLSVSIQYQLC